METDTPDTIRPFEAKWYWSKTRRKEEFWKWLQQHPDANWAKN